MFGSEGSSVAEDILWAGRFVEEDGLMRRMFCSKGTFCRTGGLAEGVFCKEVMWQDVVY
jgi:hypothetical protein